MGIASAELWIFTLDHQVQLAEPMVLFWDYDSCQAGGTGHVKLSRAYDANFFCCSTAPCMKNLLYDMSLSGLVELYSRQRHTP